MYAVCLYCGSELEFVVCLHQNECRVLCVSICKVNPSVLCTYIFPKFKLRHVQSVVVLCS